MRVLSTLAAVLLSAGAVIAGDFTVTLGAPWDGTDVPGGQQCRLFEGAGRPL